MSDWIDVRPGSYADSVRLLEISRDLAALPGVEAAQVAMATALNLEVLAGMGFAVPDTATANDLIVALRLGDQPDAARERAERALADALAVRASAAAPDGGTAPPRTTRAALRAGADLALISVPGASALVEAMDAIETGHDAMLFSDNVPLAEEVALKRAAAERGLLVMGPDCGTAVVDGIGLGFANATHPGPVGLVAASGTGCQQLLCLLDYAGVGVSWALGVGGRDLSAEVAGSSTRTALARLDADPSVELIVVVSKPPADEVAGALREYAATLATPVEFALLGAGQPDLTVAAERVLARLGRRVPTWPVVIAASRSASGPILRGLFVGGTLCEEARLLAQAHLGPVLDSVPLSADEPLPAQHSMVDYGDDRLTQGRAHPMIDPSLRLEHLARAVTDPETGVILIDVVLGHGAEPDPCPALAAVIADSRVPVVATVIGTGLDPQDRGRQLDALVTAGAEVFLSNAGAARRALDLLEAVR